MKADANSVEFTYERTLKLRLPEFRMSQNVRHLNPASFSKGAHTIELGKFEGCGCDCTVSAEVKDGMITGIKYGRCKNAREVPAKVADRMLAAHKKLTKSVGSKWEDIPVGDLVSGTAIGRMTDIIVSGDCFMVCWDEGAGEQCVICCFEKTRHWCIGPSEPTLQL